MRNMFKLIGTALHSTLRVENPHGEVLHFSTYVGTYTCVYHEGDTHARTFKIMKEGTKEPCPLCNIYMQNDGLSALTDDRRL